MGRSSSEVGFPYDVRCWCGLTLVLNTESAFLLWCLGAKEAAAELQQPEVQGAIVDSIVRAYAENQDRHDPAVGDDALTFGIHLWKSGTFFLAEQLGAIPGITAEVVNQSLTVQVGRCRLRVHKLGDRRSSTTRRRAFRNHAGPAARMGRVEQLSFKLRGRLRERDEYLDWVIGHYGSPDEGLRAVRLQAVGNERALDGKISRWEVIETLFDVSKREVVAPASSPADDLVVAPEPAIVLRVVIGDQEAPSADPA